jgi:tetraacyldisaccharide 4'-kinase
VIADLPERIWYGDAPWARAARGVLAPAGWAYGAVAAARNALYDAGLFAAHEAALPTLSLGNLSVGGTGKTPVAAWAASRLLEATARPAIVLRGYGGDEPLVHARLNPGAIVVADSNRVRGVERARSLGADCAILDDAFQHRRIRRREDWVLVAAEQWSFSLRCLPAGPMRESAASIARSTLVVVTRKSATREAAFALADALTHEAGRPLVAVIHLAADGLVNAQSGVTSSLRWLEGRRVLAVCAIGAPRAFFAQLRDAGAHVAEAAYRDHHAFDAREASGLAHRGAPLDGVVCTLKDAVKLAPLWPRKGPALWYLSQCAVVERGAAALDASLANILAARAGVSQTAGPAGPSSPPHGY